KRPGTEASRSMIDIRANNGTACPVLQVYLLGTVDFEEMLRVQRRLLYDVAADRDRAVLILCEHPPGVRVGREGSREHSRGGPAGAAGRAGVWVRARRVAQIGVAVNDWVAYFGAALNVNPDMELLKRVADGRNGELPLTSMERERRSPVRTASVRQRFVEAFR